MKQKKRVFLLLCLIAALLLSSCAKEQKIESETGLLLTVEPSAKVTVLGDEQIAVSQKGSKDVIITELDLWGMFDAEAQKKLDRKDCTLSFLKDNPHLSDFLNIDGTFVLDQMPGEIDYGYAETEDRSEAGYLFIENGWLLTIKSGAETDGSLHLLRAIAYRDIDWNK